MTTIETVIIDATDPITAEDFYRSALGLDEATLRVRPSTASTAGFRGFTLSLLTSQPGNVDAITDAALKGGATTVKPVAKSMWGYGGVLRAPDGTVLTIATSSKKDKGPASRDFDEVALLLGVQDMVKSRQFYVDRGLTVGKSFLRTYLEFDMPGSPVKLALQPRRALAKNTGVSDEGSGAHRLAIASDGEAFTDPDGFEWEASLRGETAGGRDVRAVQGRRP